MRAQQRHRYSEDFYRALRESATRSARRVVPLIVELVEPGGVIDVGCGLGTWLSAFRELGVEDVLGIDGDDVDRSLLEIPEERFMALDLAEPFELDRRFDLAVSLEVAEHLPEESADGFVDSLVRLAPVVLFSAAIPFQGGVHHVNEQWPEYWAARFERSGYVPVDCIRRRIWHDEAVDWWYAQNALLYVVRERVQRSARLRREAELTGGRPLPLVHPKKYLLLRDWAIEHYDGS